MVAPKEVFEIRLKSGHVILLPESVSSAVVVEIILALEARDC